MDTVFVKFTQVSNRLILDDSLITQLNLVSNHHVNKSYSFDYSVLIPLFSAITGGLLTILGQWAIKHHDWKKEKKNEFNDILSIASQLKIQLYFYFSSYAYSAQNTEYQLHQYHLETDITNKAKFLDEHYKSNIETLNLHKNIIEIISQFVAKATKFMILSNQKISFNTEFDEIEKIEFGDGKDYSSFTTLISDSQVSADIAELTESYRGLLSPFSSIIARMSSYKYLQRKTVLFKKSNV